ncbi:MAG TPA: YetF domain-containing protein [Sediminibacterium sp.]
MHTLQISWQFLEKPYIGIAARSLAVYLFLIIAIRIFGKKELAQLSVIDLVFILLISNSVQNAMVGPDTTLQGGLIAAAALFAANFTLKKLLYSNRFLSSLVQGDAILLVYKGKINHAHCKEAEITIEELTAAIREHGAGDVGEVDLAMLEVDGNISVVSNGFQKRTQVAHPRKHRLKGRLLKK